MSHSHSPHTSHSHSPPYVTLPFPSYCTSPACLFCALLSLLQTFQNKPAPIMAKLKPLLRRFTTVDFGRLTYYSELPPYSPPFTPPSTLPFTPPLLPFLHLPTLLHQPRPSIFRPLSSLTPPAPSTQARLRGLWRRLGWKC